MIILSPDLLALDPPEFPLSHPVIGWRNHVSAGNVTADEEAAGFPATNLGNPSTFLRWRGETTDSQTLIFDIGPVGDVDYVGVAGHNFATAGIAVSLHTLDDETWVELIEPTMPADDEPLILRFAPQPATSLRVTLAAGTEAPTAAVAYAGKLLVMERSLAVPPRFTFFPHGLEAEVINGFSESGNFLGRIVTQERQEASVEFDHITPAWYRANFDPFVRAAVEIPFFCALDPADRPGDVGFAWLRGMPKSDQDPVTERFAVELDMTGVAR